MCHWREKKCFTFIFNVHLLVISLIFCSTSAAFGCAYRRFNSRYAYLCNTMMTGIPMISAHHTYICVIAWLLCFVLHDAIQTTKTHPFVYWIIKSNSSSGFTCGAVWYNDKYITQQKHIEHLLHIRRPYAKCCYFTQCHRLSDMSANKIFDFWFSIISTDTIQRQEQAWQQNDKMPETRKSSNKQNNGQ